MKFEANSYAVTYCDTDSLLTFPVHPSAPALNTLCQISDRLGCLKVEKDDVVSFFSTAAKTYSIETATGEVTIKAKGFRLLEKLLKDNSQECLLEKNILKMFTGLTEISNVQWAPSSLIFQKQIKVNPIQMVPALLSKDKSYKLLNFIGPRRQIDLENWLKFGYERICVQDFCSTKIDPLIVYKSKTLEKKDGLFDCRNTQEALFESAKKVVLKRKFEVQLLPQVIGILPALPYGFKLDNLEQTLHFYKLVK